MRAFAIAFLSLICVTAFGAEVYRSIDDNGVVKFSDRPDEATSQRIVVATPTPASTPARTAATTRNTAQADEPVIADGGEILREPSAAERAEERRRNCQIATERVERYRASRRLYRELPNGEREYLDDAQLDSARANAAADVATWCN